MKQFILPLITLFLIGSASAQISYESPHAKDGKSIKFTLPSGYFEVENTRYFGNAMYSNVEGLNIEDEEYDGFEHGLLAVSHENMEDGSLEEFLAEIKREMKEFGPDVNFLDEPHIGKVNGKDCLMAALTGMTSERVPMTSLFINVTSFGDYMIVFYYMTSEKNDSNLNYTDFKKIVASGVEFKTDKEDGMAQLEEEMEELMEAMEAEMDEAADEYMETNYLNDLFETELSYDDILPDYGDHWDEPYDENSHLLCEFTYKEEHGSVKIFSGGLAVNYPSTSEMAKSIQLAMDYTSAMKLTYDSNFSNEDHVFKLYSIAGGGSMSSVYTTEVNKELVFFVVDGGSNPVPDFKPGVRDFMIDMWVAYMVFEEEFEEE